MEGTGLLRVRVEEAGRREDGVKVQGLGRVMDGLGGDDTVEGLSWQRRTRD